MRCGSTPATRKRWIAWPCCGSSSNDTRLAAEYRRLPEVTPESARTHAHLGVTRSHLGRVEEAVRSFELALPLDPALEAARAALERIGAPRRGPARSRARP